MAAQEENTAPAHGLFAGLVGPPRPPGWEDATDFELVLASEFDELGKVMQKEMIFPDWHRGADGAVKDPYLIHQGFVRMHEALGKACNRIATALPARPGQTNSAEASSSVPHVPIAGEDGPPKKRARFDEPVATVLTPRLPTLEEGNEVLKVVQTTQARGAAFVRRHVAACAKDCELTIVSSGEDLQRCYDVRTPAGCVPHEENQRERLATLADLLDCGDVDLEVRHVIEILMGNMVHIRDAWGKSLVVKGPRVSTCDEDDLAIVCASLVEKWKVDMWADFTSNAHESAQ